MIIADGNRQQALFLSLRRVEQKIFSIEPRAVKIVSLISMKHEILDTHRMTTGEYKGLVFGSPLVFKNSASKSMNSRSRG